MNYIIANHDGNGPLGTSYSEAQFIADQLRLKGHASVILTPDVGLKRPFNPEELVVITTQPAKNTELVLEFLKCNPHVRIAIRPGWAQLECFEQIVTSRNVQFVQICIQKANSLVRQMSCPDAAADLSLNGSRQTKVVVTGPFGAAVGNCGRVIHVPATPLTPTQTDGLGATHFGALLGSVLNGMTLAASLAAANRAAGDMALGVVAMPVPPIDPPQFNISACA